jgi:hypothetical protein
MAASTGFRTVSTVGGDVWLYLQRSKEGRCQRRWGRWQTGKVTGGEGAGKEKGGGPREHVRSVRAAAAKTRRARDPWESMHVQNKHARPKSMHVQNKHAIE